MISRRTQHRAEAQVRRRGSLSSKRGLLFGVTYAITFCWSASAFAVDADVSSQTAAQAYSLRSPFGNPIVDRRRITQTLGLGVYNILGDEKVGGPQLTFKLRMRLDAELGVDSSETGYTRGDPSSRYVPGLAEAPIDLMYGYLEGRNLLGGHFGFKLGRSYLVDALGWWSFDGALARLNVPYAHVEVYGGFEQRSGLPLSLGRYEQRGVWRGDRSNLDGSPDVYPMFQQAALAPAYGFALESETAHWVHARIDYRKVYNKGSVITKAFAGADGKIASLDTIRTSSDRLGFQADATADRWGAVRAGGVYDFFNGFISSYNGSLDAFVTQKLTASAEFDYYKPTFDGDSIWNWFTHTPVTTATGRVAWEATQRLDLSLSAGARFWETDDNPDASTQVGSSVVQYASTKPSDPNADNTQKITDFLGSAYARYGWSTGRASARGIWEFGDRGRRAGVDLAGERYFVGGKWVATARGSLFDWRDELRPDRSATSVGYVVGGGWRPAQYANVMLEWEHNTNHIVGQRYRVLALVNVLVGK